MVYKVSYLDSVENDFKKLDRPTQKRIINKIENHLAKDPQHLGKVLTGQFKGFWRYRVGDFRIIYKIAESEILIIVSRIGHRKNIYS